MYDKDNILAWLKRLSDKDFAETWNRYLDNNRTHEEPEYIYTFDGEYYTTVHTCEGRSLLKYSLPLIDNFDYALEELVDGISEYPDEYDYME